MEFIIAYDSMAVAPCQPKINCSIIRNLIYSSTKLDDIQEKRKTNLFISLTIYWNG